MRALSWLLLFACSWSLATSRATDLDDANRRYDEGQFAEAKAGYEKWDESGHRSANLFYNLGNALFRLDAPGEAALAYERALALDPAHPEARANLVFVRERTGAARWPATLLDQLLPRQWADVFAVIGVAGAWTALLALATKARRPGPAFWPAVVAAVLIAGYSAAVAWRAEQDRSLAVVTAKTTELRLAPADSAGVAGALTAGSEVRALSERGDWIYCAAPSGGRGWLPAKSVARIHLGDS